MKAKALIAALLVAVAATADARFAWPYPRKSVSPEESGQWIVTNADAWSVAEAGSTVESRPSYSSMTAVAYATVVRQEVTQETLHLHEMFSFDRVKGE